MRIISGKFKNRKINSIDGVKTRPLCNNIQEALFNILRDVEDVDVLELYAGFGLFSWEAISRGAKSSVFVEKSRKMVEKIKKTGEALDVLNQITVVQKDIFKGLTFEKESFNLIFADPPFYLDLCSKTIELVMNSGWLKKNGIFVIRHYEKENIISDFSPILEKIYSESVIKFYKKSS
ncbi:MAG: 16S rRNA (guanine(966)-N(2))-methyltransferase RsmD [Candidatus Muirbacterium halophilum]|nr:16S rRNA (guanine(966)-N(2))-methyltransferase RsmD [Candidatus Muirbacterium halophilum]MCK9475457.1 16S rRNA (guanine(966)-N(2))-methyltransferase RsmD [Candidatus Muirbacterium halophilum]